MPPLVVPLTPPGSFIVSVVFDNHPAVKAKLAQAGHPIPPPIVTKALIDTGATMCLLPSDLIGTLGLPTMSDQRQLIVTAAGARPSKNYYGSLHLEARPDLKADYTRIATFDPDQELPFRAVLGTTALSQWNFSYEASKRALTLDSPG